MYLGIIQLVSIKKKLKTKLKNGKHMYAQISLNQCQSELYEYIGRYFPLQPSYLYLEICVNFSYYIVLSSHLLHAKDGTPTQVSKDPALNHTYVMPWSFCASFCLGLNQLSLVSKTTRRWWKLRSKSLKAM